MFVYRDIWPLAKFGGTPLDASQGPVLWVEIALLAVTGVIIPLAVPRHHIPLDVVSLTLSSTGRTGPERGIQKSQTPPAPEQTCSIFSLIIWSVLNPVVVFAYKNGRMDDDSLPPLADYDNARHLAETSLPLLNPLSGKKRHIFWGLMTIYREQPSAILTPLSNCFSRHGLSINRRHDDSPSPYYTCESFWYQ